MKMHVEIVDPKSIKANADWRDKENRTPANQKFLCLVGDDNTWKLITVDGAMFPHLPPHSWIRITLQSGS